MFEMESLVDSMNDNIKVSDSENQSVSEKSNTYVAN